MENLRISKSLLGKEELDEVEGVLESGFLTQGPKVAEFEEIIRKYVGSKYAFATSSATTALHLSAVALGIGPGDEVLVSDLTFPATSNIVVQQGAIPVPVDIDSDNYCMNVDDLKNKITSKTKAIIPVDAFGLTCDIGTIMEIANTNNIPVIQDSACSLGSTYDGRRIGTFATTTCFSFHPRKSITTGEGGMLMTESDEIAGIVTKLRTHGGMKKEFYMSFEEAGFNYRMSDVHAAIGVAQSRKLDYLLSERSKLATELTSRLSEIKGVKCPSTPSNRTHTNQSFVVILPRDVSRDNIIRRLRAEKIETTLGTYALHAQPFFQREYGYKDGDCPVSYQVYEHSLTLPLWVGMTSEHLERIVQSLKKVLQEERS